MFPLHTLGPPFAILLTDIPSFPFNNDMLAILSKATPDVNCFSPVIFFELIQSEKFVTAFPSVLRLSKHIFACRIHCKCSCVSTNCLDFNIWYKGGKRRAPFTDTCTNSAASTVLKQAGRLRFGRFLELQSRWRYNKMLCLFWLLDNDVFPLVNAAGFLWPSSDNALTLQCYSFGEMKNWRAL